MKIRRIEYYFRADGNDRIGAGHLTRCLTIADALSKVLGTEGGVCFLTADEQSAGLAERYKTVVLGTDYRNMEEELPILEKLFAGRQREELPDGAVAESVDEAGFVAADSMADGFVKRLFLVDSYFVTEAYLEALGAYGGVWLLDDLEQCAYPVSAVLNYNAFASPERYQRLYQGRQTACYVGSTYVPIRPQFLRRDYQVRPEVKKVLVTTGGADPYNLAVCVTKAIWRENCDYYLVAGRFNRHLEELRAWETVCPQVHVCVDVKEMASLMRECDLAITAGGTTVYELAAVGVPFVCFSYAENQEALTRYMGEKDIACYAGAYHKNSRETIAKLAECAGRLWEDYELRKSYKEKEQNLIDGRGAERIARLLTESMEDGEEE